MKEIVATEQIFSPLSNGRPVAIRYHYADGTSKEVPIPSPEGLVYNENNWQDEGTVSLSEEEIERQTILRNKKK